MRFLLAVWGRKYVDGLMAAALPSYLAPGNLPALAERTELEVIILTTSGSVLEFGKHAAFARLQQLCPVRFVMIDDLIPFRLYGIILTAAFARGVKASGTAQTDTHFIFMNADFILADGSLRSLARRIVAGEPCIMAGSLRAKEEALLPHLAAAVDPSDHALAVSPRELARLALAQPHPTVLGKTVNQSLMHCEPCNQLYWRVDEHTLLARFYLLHMTCIRPERPLEHVNSYCDYGFVPELVPSGRVTAFTDSDEFFLLELQAAASEKDFLRAGPLALPSLATSLAEWSTAQHRRNAHFELLFHSRDVPKNLDVTRRAAGDLVAQVEALLPAPRSHANHPYWTYSLDERLDRLAAPETDLPHGQPDGGRHPDTPIGWPPEISTRLFPDDPAAPLLPDVLGERRSWHVDAGRIRLVRDTLTDAIRGVSGPILYIGRHGSPLAAAVARDPRFETVHLNAFSMGFVPPEIAQRRYDRIVCHAIHDAVDHVPAAVATSLPLLATGGAVIVVLEDDFSKDRLNGLARRLGSLIAQLASIDADLLELEPQFVGGRAYRRLRRLERRFTARPRRRWKRWLRKPVVWVGHVVVPLLAMQVNRRHARPRSTPMADCGCAVLTMRYPQREEADRHLAQAQRAGDGARDEGRVRAAPIASHQR